MENCTRFALSNGKKVERKANKLFDLAKQLVSDRGGDLEEIRRTQFSFNDAVRLAHAEILSIPSNKALIERRK